MIRCRQCDRHHLSSAASCPFCGEASPPQNRLANTATAALSSVVLMACYGSPGELEPLDPEPAYMDYACTTEQLEDPSVVKCCLPDGTDSTTTQPLNDTGLASLETCDPAEELLGAGERCCPVDASVE